MIMIVVKIVMIVQVRVDHFIMNVQEQMLFLISSIAYRRVIIFYVFYSDACERARSRWGVEEILLGWPGTGESHNP